MDDSSKIKPNVFFLSLLSDTPCRGYWDQAFIEDLLAQYEKQEVRELPNTTDAIVIIPARSHKNKIDEINTELAKIKNCLLVLTGDEESVFPVEHIKHDNIKIWVQNARKNRHEGYTRFGTGYPPQLANILPDEAPEKDLDIFFAGQVTHKRRKEAVSKIKNLNEYKYKLLETEGFTQGLEHKEYLDNFSRAIYAPCPSGPETPDSFRLYEALENGCIPFADTLTPKADNSDFGENFYDFLFMEKTPLPLITDWASVRGYIQSIQPTWKKTANNIMAWYMRYKNNMKNRLHNDLRTLNITDDSQCQVTAIVPVSPIKSHPSIEIVKETIDSIRHHYPDCRIFLTFDGVREEQKGRAEDYEEFKRRLLWYCNRKVKNVVPYIFDEHLHQIGMMRAIVDDIKTPLLLYIEQDAPLVTDCDIDWKFCEQAVISGSSNMIRFHFEAHIPEEHNYLMLGKPQDGLQKTIQWSQRPHLASTAYYCRMLKDYFTAIAKTFIEDCMHSVLIEDYKKHGFQGWNQHRIHIYHPEGNIKRSYHTDGRAGEEKFDKDLIF